MTIKDEQRSIIDEFNQFSDWEEKYTHIIKLGRELPPYPEEYRTDKFMVSGCQSQVWIHSDLVNEKVEFQADSDAMIVKGLIAILLKVYSGRHPDEILSNPPEFISAIGIDTHLSPTRKNGLSSMLKQIQMYALAYKSVMKNHA